MILLAKFVGVSLLVEPPKGCGRQRQWLLREPQDKPLALPTWVHTLSAQPPTRLKQPGWPLRIRL